MIRHISGEIVYVGNDHIVVDVSGVGYLLYVSQPQSFTLGNKTKLYTHHAIRETASDLYGFVTLDELEVFELLLGLPKIGPKSAAQILSQTDLETLITAVSHADPEHLTKLSGIGKKTAEKIVAGLKEVFAERGYGETEWAGTGGAPSGFQADAVDALITLGYPHAEARRAIQALPSTITTVNDAVSAALKELSQS